jgi:glycine/D-amino acid oxidase-like deaminating enzyme
MAQSRLLVVGAGLFGSLAAALARRHGFEVAVFDPHLPGAASPCAAGLISESWVGARHQAHLRSALPVLDELYGFRRLELAHDDGRREAFRFIPPAQILEPAPIRAEVTAAGDGWIEAAGERHEGVVYLAAGVWCRRFLPDLELVGKAGSAFLFHGERAGRIRPFAPSRQAIAFVRDAGSTYFSDGTAERDFTAWHDEQTLARARALGLEQPPLERLHGVRPYSPGGPVFRRLGQRTWLATGGRKLGTLFAASLATRLLDELRSS